AAPCYDEESTEQATDSLETTSQEDSVSDNVELFQKTSKDQVLKQLTAIAKEPKSSVEEPKSQETMEDITAAEESTGIPQKRLCLRSPERKETPELTRPRPRISARLSRGSAKR
ncbi:hypothetical protein OSTOST_05476, partial [Ostertagia ostertagi]